MAYGSQYEFPRTQTWDSDLRQILEMYFKLKGLPDEWTNYQTTLNAQWDAYKELMNGNFTDLKNFVNNYFDNLDVQDEINNKIDAMAASGELLNIAKDTIISTTDAWLSGNISNPASPPLDSTLMLSNAAAQSQITGKSTWTQIYGFGNFAITMNDSRCNILFAGAIQAFLIDGSRGPAVNSLSLDNVTAGSPVYVVVDVSNGAVEITLSEPKAFKKACVMILTAANGNHRIIHQVFPCTINGKLMYAPAIDSGLTVNGAGADAFITGISTWIQPYGHGNLLVTQSASGGAVDVVFSGAIQALNVNGSRNNGVNALAISNVPYGSPLYLILNVATGVFSFTVENPKIMERALIIAITGSNGSLRIVHSECIITVNGIMPGETKPQKLVGKKIIFMGDSITSTVLIESRRWSLYFLQYTGASQIANVAVWGARLEDYSNTVLDGNPTQNLQQNNTLSNQVQKILNNDYETPDYIIIAIGTNDGITATAQECYNSYYTSAGELIDIDTLDRTIDANAFRYAVEKLRGKYPSARIIFCAPIQAQNAQRNVNSIIQWGNALQLLCKYGSVGYVDTCNCGIVSSMEIDAQHLTYTADGLHPNEAGAQLIAQYNAGKICTENFYNY